MSLTPTQLPANTVLASPSGATGPLGVRTIAAADITSTGCLARLSGYATGTPYNLTATAAQVAPGTGSASITIATAGTYLILAAAHLLFSGATFAANRTATLTVHRTNNTPGDITNATRTVQTGVVTTLTGDAGTVVLPPTIYTATAGDMLQIFGSVSIIPTAGNLQCDSAEIIAIRIA